LHTCASEDNCDGETDTDWLQFCRHCTAVTLCNVCLAKCNLYFNVCF